MQYYKLPLFDSILATHKKTQILQNTHQTTVALGITKADICSKKVRIKCATAAGVINHPKRKRLHRICRTIVANCITRIQIGRKTPILVFINANMDRSKRNNHIASNITNSIRMHRPMSLIAQVSGDVTCDKLCLCACVREKISWLACLTFDALNVIYVSVSAEIIRSLPRIPKIKNSAISTRSSGIAAADQNVSSIPTDDHSMQSYASHHTMQQSAFNGQEQDFNVHSGRTAQGRNENSRYQEAEP